MGSFLALQQKVIELINAASELSALQRSANSVLNSIPST